MRQILNNFFATLRRYKVSSSLNILGLSVAFASFYLIMVQVLYDFNYNRNITDSERIYRMELKDASTDNVYDAYAPRPLFQPIVNASAQVESHAVVQMIGDVLYSIGQRGDVESIEANKLSATDGIIDLLDLNIAIGDKTQFRRSDNTNIIVSKSLAKRYNLTIGDELYVTGYLAALDNSKRRIVAIYEDIVEGTDFSDVELIENIGDADINNTSQWSYNYYVKLQTEADINRLYAIAKDNFRAFVRDVYGEDEENIDNTVESEFQFRLLPITKSYFETEFTPEGCNTGDKSVSYMLFAIAIFIIMLALVNFVNFFFALVPIRIKAVNTHKIFGCSRSKLIGSFIFETFGLVICAIVLALLFVLFAGDSELTTLFSTSILLEDNLALIMVVVTIAILISIITAIYPALYITSFPAAMAIKGGFVATKSGKAIRYTLIGVQFVTSITLLCCTLFTQLQYNYLLRADMGFQKSNILTTDTPFSISQELSRRNDFTGELMQNPQIIDVTYGQGELVASRRMNWSRSYGDKQLTFTVYPVSYNFLDFIGIHITEGRNFRESDQTNGVGTYIINENGMKEFELTLDDRVPAVQNETEIVGVCKDFNFNSLHAKIKPFAFFVYGDERWLMPQHTYIKLSQEAEAKDIISFIKETIKLSDPTCDVSMIKFQYFDAELGATYDAEHKLTTLISIFTIISMVISLMGVFGLVLFETQFRQQEIVIRRVHGATVPEILMMINRKFLIIIAVCFAVSAPVSYLIVSRWLSTFAFHISISAWVFVAVLAVVTVVTTSIVTVQSLKAANTNPAELIGKNS